MKSLGQVGAALVIAAMTGLIPLEAGASTIAYNFTVNITTGPLAPETLHGSFAYDSSTAVPGGSVNATGLLTKLDFTFNAVTYSAATANTGGMNFDSTGTLTGAEFGDICSPGVCTVLGGDWAVDNSVFFYKEVGDVTLWTGDVSYSQGGVPEPAIWAMLLAGFFGIGAMARRVKRAASATA